MYINQTVERESVNTSNEISNPVPREDFVNTGCDDEDTEKIDSLQGGVLKSNDAKNNQILFMNNLEKKVQNIVCPKLSSIIKGKELTFELLSKSTETSSNNTSNLVSMLPTSSSNFDVKSASITGCTQIITNIKNSDFTTNINNQHYKPLFMVFGGNDLPLQFAPIFSYVIVSKESSDFDSKKNAISLQPINLPQEVQYFKPVPPAIPIDTPYISFSAASSYCIENQNSFLTKELKIVHPKLIPKISNVHSLKVNNEMCVDIEKLPDEYNHLCPPEPIKDTEINVPSTSSGIRQQMSLRTSNHKHLMLKRTISERTSHQNDGETSNLLPIKMFISSSIKPIEDTEMNVPSTSSGKIDQNSLRTSTHKHLILKQSKEMAKINYLSSPEPIEDTEMNGLLSLKLNNISPCKLIPPAPVLKILMNKFSDSFTLIINMDTSSDISKIRCFQLYSYHKSTSKVFVNKGSWRKLREINSISVPVACIIKKRLNQVKCKFFVRAVDIHNRIGPFSSTKSIFIE